MYLIINKLPKTATNEDMESRIGTYLKQSRQDVTLLDYWKDHVHRINEKGIEVQTENETYVVEMRATFPEEVKETYDIIVLLTKSMQSEQMMQTLKEQEQLARILPSYV